MGFFVVVFAVVVFVMVVFVMTVFWFAAKEVPPIFEDHKKKNSSGEELIHFFDWIKRVFF